jgi:HEXXH motif-containing protein
MTAILDQHTIHTLISITGDSLLVRGLYDAQYHKTLLQLHHLRQKLLIDYPAVADRTGFTDAYQALASIDPMSQRTLLTYPSFGFWIDLAWEQLQEDKRSSQFHPQLQLHLQEFWRFVLAAKIISGSVDFECKLPFHPHGCVALPGTGAYLQVSPVGISELVPVVLHDGRLECELLQTSDKRLKLEKKAIPLLRNGIEFNAVDRDLSLPGHSNLTYENVSTFESVKWVAVLNDAWEWIDEQEPLLIAEMMLILRAIVPLKALGSNWHSSGSFGEAPGLIALSLDLDVPVMVEALVHEYHHQKLNALLNLDSLIVGPTHEPIYFSPWRREPRPLIGLLHGIYTFQAVAGFWIKALESRHLDSFETPIRTRVAAITKQLNDAVETVKEHAMWSDLGQAYFHALLTRVSELTTLAKCIGSTSSICV